MHISVVIPTYNRSEILHECLEALSKQTLPHKDFEVLIVDDGSKDKTREVVEFFQKDHENIYYFYQKNQGQGVARNLAISKAKGEVVVMIGDDIIPVPDFLHEHLRYHLRYNHKNEAVLGFTDWHPKLKVTPFMRWLTNGSAVLGKFGGHQFAYEKLEGKEKADFNFFYTSNISLKTALLQKYPFDPSFSGYGWEDIELGYRLYKHENLRLYYNKKALGFHDHMMNEESLPKRMRDIGRSAWVFQRKYPELKKIPRGIKKIVFGILSLSLTTTVLKFIHQDLYYYALSKKYFLEGIREGEKDQKKFLEEKIVSAS